MRRPPPDTRPLSPRVTAAARTSAHPSVLRATILCRRLRCTHDAHGHNDAPSVIDADDDSNDVRAAPGFADLGQGRPPTHSLLSLSAGKQLKLRLKKHIRHGRSTRSPPVARRRALRAPPSAHNSPFPSFQRGCAAGHGIWRGGQLPRLRQLFVFCL